MLLETQGQFVFHFRQGGDPEDYLCTLGYDTGEGAVAPVESIAQAAYEAWRDNILLFQSSAITFTEVEMQLRLAEGVTSVSFLGDDTGGRQDASLLQNTAYLVHKNTAAVGRGRSGRMYVPGVPDNKVSNIGVVDLAELAAINAGLSDFLAEMDPGEAGAVVVNHGEGGTFDAPSAITSFSLDPVCGSQRRRLRH